MTPLRKDQRGVSVAFDHAMARGLKHMPRIIAALLFIVTISPSAFADDTIFDVPRNGALDVQIDGSAVTVFSSPGMPSTLEIRQSLGEAIFGNSIAQVAKENSGFRVFSISLPRGEIEKEIGPVKMPGFIMPSTVGFDGRIENAYVSWYRQSSYEFGDGLAGPYALPAQNIRYTLADPQPGEVTQAFPLLSDRRWWLASTSQEINGKTVIFAFAPQFERTTVSAEVGALLAESHEGHFTTERLTVVISHGVARPARELKLKRPLVFGSFRISSLLVRSTDYGYTSEIARASDLKNSNNSGDEEEGAITVNGKFVKTHGKKRYLVYVGKDVLNNCSSITYKKPTKIIEISCLLAD